MSNGFVHFKKSRIFFREYGHGNNIILAFHGFGLDSHSWKPLAEQLGDNYRVFAFDHWFHGKSVWNERQYLLTKDDLTEIVTGFLDQQRIERCTLLGFSLGGKFCLSIYERIPDRIERLVLIAPDGIGTSFWYNLAVYPIFFQGLLKRMIFNPLVFHKAVLLIRFLRLVDEGLVRFAEKRMRTRSQRGRVYFTWIHFKMIVPDLKRVSQQLNAHKTPFTLVTGIFDRIISLKGMKSFLLKVNDFNSVTLPTGHNALIAEYANYLSENLREQP